MLIENKIKDILAPEKPWETASGTITTFTREHVALTTKEPAIPWQPLMEEVHRLDPRASIPLTLSGTFSSSIGHLKWLMLLHNALLWLWFTLGVLMILSFLQQMGLPTKLGTVNDMFSSLPTGEELKCTAGLGGGGSSGTVCTSKFAFNCLNGWSACPLGGDNKTCCKKALPPPNNTPKQTKKARDYKSLESPHKNTS